MDTRMDMKRGAVVMKTDFWEWMVPGIAVLIVVLYFWSVM
jgi:hypothetical protein